MTTVALALALVLVGCSFIDGVFRYLSFDQDVTRDDFVCLTEALKSKGYDARYTPINKSVIYDLKHPDLGHMYYASFRSFKRDKDGKVMEISDEISHQATYGGSEPNECTDVKPAAAMLVSIEKQVLKICNLALVKKPKQKISCKR